MGKTYRNNGDSFERRSRPESNKFKKSKAHHPNKKSYENDENFEEFKDFDLKKDHRKDKNDNPEE